MLLTIEKKMEEGSAKKQLRDMSSQEADDIIHDLAMMAGKLQFAVEQEFRKHCIKVLSTERGLPEDRAAEEASDIWWRVIHIRVEGHED